MGGGGSHPELQPFRGLARARARASDFVADLGDVQAASRGVEVGAIEPAELRDAQAAEDQRVE
jgi:hypothetical protein